MRPAPRIDGSDEPSATAGDALLRWVVGAGLWLLALCLAAVALSALGWWRPAVALPLAVAAAVVLGRGLRSGRLPLPRPALRLLPTLTLLAIALGVTVWAGLTSADQVLPRRDSASNLQAAISLARTGERVVPLAVEPVGGPAVLTLPGITVASPAFYATGPVAAPSIQPQFVIGPAAIYSLGVWVGGVSGAVWCAAVAAGLGVIAIGLLAARTIGGRWGPVAAAITALSYPLLHLSRSTYSEPLSLLTLGAGLLALTCAVESDGGSAPERPASTRRWALIAGLLIGGTAFVRIDGLREAILLIPVAALGLVQGARWPRPLLVGAAASTALAFASALALSNQYLGSIARSLLPLVGIGVATAGLAWLALRLQRGGRRLPTGYAVRLPSLLSGLTALVLLGLASRPLWLVTRQDPADPGSRYVAGMQAREGLPIDGGRTYAEHTITWLSWWLGPVTLVVAGAALVVAVHRLGRQWVAGERLPAWSAPLVVAVGSTLMTLWRPGITPDHPWAERRLVIAVPCVVLLAVAAIAHLAELRVRTPDTVPHGDPGPARTAQGTRSRLPGIPALPRTRPARWAAAAAVALAIVGPTAVATLPFATARVEAGEGAAVERVCAALAPGEVVLAVDSRAANEWPQVIRGQCGRESLSTTGALRKDPTALAATVETIRAAVGAAGGHLVLLSADDQAPAVPGGPAWQVAVDTTVQESQHVLERRPDRLEPLRIVVRLARP